MLNICSSVQDHNQSTIHKDSDWTSQRAKEFYVKLRASEEMRLKKCVWRNESEDRAPEDTSTEAMVIRSYFTRVDKVQCTKCTTTISATLSLHQDKINSNIAADFVAFQVEWIWN